MCPEKHQLLFVVLKTGSITATISDSHHYSNNLLQGGFEDRLLHFFIYGHSAC